MKTAHLTLLSLIFVVLIAGVLKIVPTSSHRIFFEPNAPQLITLDSLKKSYGSTDNVVITLIDTTEQILSHKTLIKIDAIQKELEKLEHLTTLESILTQSVLKTTPFGIKQTPLIPAPYEKVSPQQFDSLERQITKSSLYLNLYIDSSGDAAGIHCTFNLEDAPPRYAEYLRMKIRSIVEGVCNDESLDYSITGGLYIDGVFTEAGLRDSRLLTPLMIGVILLLLWYIYRSPRLIVAFSLAVFPTPLIVMGVAGWLGIPFSPSLAVVPIITLAISTATSVHIITAYKIVLKSEKPGHNSLSKALVRCRAALFFTALTTMVGFLTLNMSKTPPFRIMGNLAALGTALALFNALYLLPKLLLLLKVIPPTNMPRFFDTIHRKIAAITTESPKRVLAGAVMIFTLTVPGLWKLSSNDSFINYFDTRFQFRRDTDKTLKHLTGVDYLQISLTAPKTLADSAYMQNLLSFSEWCQDQDHVRHALALPSIIQEHYKTISGDSVSTLPPDKTIELFLKKMRNPHRQRSFIHATDEASQLFILLDKLSSQELLQLAQQCTDKAEDIFGKEHVLIGSTSLLFANLSISNSRAMRQGMLLSLFFITIILLVITSRILWGALTVLPNLLPVLISFGLWGLYAQKSGLGLSVVAPMSLGIIVDDTVHFITHYSRFRKKGFAPKESLLKTYAELVYAVLSTTIILTAGFLTLTISGFTPTKEMGLLTALTVLLALLGDLLLLPALLMIFDRDKQKEG